MWRLIGPVLTMDHVLTLNLAHWSASMVSANRSQIKQPSLKLLPLFLLTIGWIDWPAAAALPLTVCEWSEEFRITRIARPHTFRARCIELGAAMYVLELHNGILGITTLMLIFFGTTLWATI